MIISTRYYRNSVGLLLSVFFKLDSRKFFDKQHCDICNDFSFNVVVSLEISQILASMEKSVHYIQNL